MRNVILAVADAKWHGISIGNLYIFEARDKTLTASETMQIIERLQKPCAFYKEHLPLTELLNAPYYAGRRSGWKLYTLYPFIVVR